MARSPSHRIHAGYSPDISAELRIGGMEFRVASLGPGSIVLHNPVKCQPGMGIVRMRVEQQATVYHLNLMDGVDPNRRDQPFVLIAAFEEAAA